MKIIKIMIIIMLTIMHCFFFDRLACVVIYLKVQIHKANKTPLNMVQRYPFYVALMRKRLSPFNPFKVVCVSANTDRGIYI